jgi:hypothetical protein
MNEIADKHFELVQLSKVNFKLLVQSFKNSLNISFEFSVTPYGITNSVRTKKIVAICVKLSSTISVLY